MWEPVPGVATGAAGFSGFSGATVGTDMAGCGARFGAPAGDGGVTAIPAAAVAAAPVAGGAAAPAGGRVGGTIASGDGDTGAAAEDS